LAGPSRPLVLVQGPLRPVPGRLWREFWTPGLMRWRTSLPTAGAGSSASVGRWSLGRLALASWPPGDRPTIVGRVSKGPSRPFAGPPRSLDHYTPTVTLTRPLLTPINCLRSNLYEPVLSRPPQHTHRMIRQCVGLQPLIIEHSKSKPPSPNAIIGEVAVPTNAADWDLGTGQPNLIRNNRKLPK